MTIFKSITSEVIFSKTKINDFSVENRKSILMFLPLTGSFLLVEYGDLQNILQMRSCYNLVYMDRSYVAPVIGNRPNLCLKSMAGIGTRTRYLSKRWYQKVIPKLALKIYFKPFESPWESSRSSMKIFAAMNRNRKRKSGIASGRRKVVSREHGSAGSGVSAQHSVETGRKKEPLDADLMVIFENWVFFLPFFTTIWLFSNLHNLMLNSSYRDGSVHKKLVWEVYRAGRPVKMKK